MAAANPKKKKSRRFRRFRALFILVLLILLLLLLDGRLGLGPGGNSLFFKTSQVTTEENVTAKKIIEIRENDIFYANQLMTIDALKTALNDPDKEALYVLRDLSANYGVFTEVEHLLKDAGFTYTIEN